jgi:hypothetical protein
MATKTFNAEWMGQYRADNNSYVGGGSPVRVGGSPNYQSFIGIPTAVRDALNSSRTTPGLKMQIYVTDPAEFDIGGHKETYNKAGGTMPWYRYTGLHPYLASGWQVVELKYDFMNEYRDGDYTGLVLYGSTANLGVAENTTAYPVKFIVEGTWNQSPLRPSLTFPKGGEVVDQSLTVRWTAGSDPDGDPLSYRVAIKTQAGWDYYTTNTTSLTVNTANFEETSDAMVGVQSYDGQEYSSYTFSEYFTINHNEPPAVPTQLSPSNGELKDRTGVVRFSWKHNDDGAQAGFRMGWRLKGNTAWNYIPNSTSFMNTTNQYYDMPANTLPFGDIEWLVQTKDQFNLESQYNSPVVFRASNPSSAPIILEPAHMGTVTGNRVEVRWSSLSQLEWEYRLMDTNGLLLDSRVGYGATKYLQPPVTLENNKWYEVHVRVKDSITQIWSDWAVSAFGTSFTPPTKPRVETYEEAGEGVLNLKYSAKAPNIMPRFMANGIETGVVTDYSGILMEVTGDYSIKVDTLNQGWAQVLIESPVIVTPTVGRSLTLESTTDATGGRILLQALDANNNVLAENYSSSSALPPQRLNRTITVPMGTRKLKAVFYSATREAGADFYINHTDISLSVPDSSTPAVSVDILRREYTPSGIEPWVLIERGAPVKGSYFDYTLASDVVYEYVIRSHGDNGTSIDSDPYQVTIEYDGAFLQEAHNITAVNYLGFVTARDEALEVDSRLARFAGRRDPVREFGEHEELTLEIEWEVQSYAEVRAMRNLLRNRDIVLYRDGSGRRLWVTTGELSVQDRPVSGFVLSTTLTQTSYVEDLNLRDEEGLM